ncbi:MAG: hypothetical protein HQK67_06605 [Desulfamplus sp.]|nr:hypothetical protein [Desulfamplus sp.]
MTNDKQNKKLPKIRFHRNNNNSNILLISPHGVLKPPYDDENTGRLALRLAKNIGCHAVINRTFHRDDCDLNLVAHAEQVKEFIDSIKDVVDNNEFTYVFWIHGIHDDSITPIDPDAECLIGYGQPDKDEEPRYTAKQETINKLIETFKNHDRKAIEAPPDSIYRGYYVNRMNQWFRTRYSLDKVQSIQLEFKYDGIRDKKSLDSAAKNIGRAIKEVTEEEFMAKDKTKEAEQGQVDKAVPAQNKEQVQPENAPPAQVETDIPDAEVLTSTEEKTSDDTKPPETNAENKIAGTLSTEVKGITEDGNVGDTAQADIKKNLPVQSNNSVIDTTQEDVDYEAITDEQLAAMPEDDKVDVTFNKLKGIFVKHFHNAMLDAGQYIIKVLYNNNYDLEKPKGYTQSNSISKLIKKLKQDSPGNSPSRTWIYDAINLALDNNYFNNIEDKEISSAYGRLGHSHKVNLTYAPDDKKEKLISEIITIEAETNKKCSVVKIRELINREKRESAPDELPLSEALKSDFSTLDTNLLKDLQKELDIQYKKLQEKVKFYKTKSDEIKNLLKPKTN